MPSIPLSFLYTTFAVLAVGGLLLLSFSAYTGALRASSEMRKLEGLLDHVASITTELLTLTMETNAFSEIQLPMPETIGDRYYWLQLGNDSNSAWLEGGFGNNPVHGVGSRAYVPSKILAQGYYISGNGAVQLECYTSLNLTQITLSSSREGK